MGGGAELGDFFVCVCVCVCVCERGKGSKTKGRGLFTLVLPIFFTSTVG